MIPKTLFETKSPSQPARSNSLAGFFDFLGMQGFTDLQAHLAVRYYLTAQPVASGIDKIAEPFAEIEPRVFDTKSKEFVEHDVLQLLGEPNPEDSTESFFAKLGAWYLINGEVYLNATGQVNKPPLELFACSASNTSVAPDKNGFLGTIQFGKETNQQIYKQAFNTVGGRFRYYNRDNDGEAWQIRNFNAKNGLRGGSKLQSIMSEIEQYIESSTHNLSLLMRGARPSGIFAAKEALTDDQFERLKEQIDNWYSGAANAGRPILVDGGDGIDYQTAIMSNRDMDFVQLKENVTESIFTRLDVPLALISTKAMTLDNFKVAKLSLYDDAVLPLTNRIFGELTQLLMPRYKNSENLVITYNAAAIPALEARRMENAKMRKDIAVNTVNELRSILGDATIDGGDDLIQPAQTQMIDEKTQYENLLREQKDANGNRLFSEHDIKNLSKTYY
jgi:HK97 family phage portal protein